MINGPPFYVVFIFTSEYDSANISWSTNGKTKLMNKT